MLNNGQYSERWIRLDCLFYKTNGKWLIEHEHVSVLSDIQSDKAMLNLRPSSLAE